MSLLAIEFDISVFPNVVVCKQWLRDQPDYSYILQHKNFRLKTVAKSLYMAPEGRKVLAWYGELWRHKNLQLVRLTNHVAVILRDGGDSYTEADVPTLSPDYLSKKYTQEQKESDHDRKLLEKKAASTLKKRAASKPKRKSIAKSQAIVDEDPIEAAERKQKAKEEKKKRLADSKPASKKRKAANKAAPTKAAKSPKKTEVEKMQEEDDLGSEEALKKAAKEATQLSKIELEGEILREVEA